MGSWGYILYWLRTQTLYTRNTREATQLAVSEERDTLGISFYSEFATYHINDRHKNSEQYLDTLYQMCSKSKWPKAEGIYLWIKGRYYDKQGNMDEALRLYNQASDTLRNAGPPYKDLGMALVGAGFVLLNTGLYEESLAYPQRGI